MTYQLLHEAELEVSRPYTQSQSTYRRVENTVAVVIVVKAFNAAPCAVQKRQIQDR